MNASGRGQSRVFGLPSRLVLTGIAVALLSALAPAPATAHGPVNPVASSYLARIGSAPPGVEAKVLDGDQRMWLQARPDMTVIVVDYRRAPYLRFSRAGVEVNENSAMYYLNQTPVPFSVPTNLGPRTPPRWHPVSGGHSYSWHDGRLHALASVALAPGSSYVGVWRVPLIVDGRATAISGGLWHAADPPIVWFWPIVVVLACVLAAWRLRRPALDRRLARGLGLAALVSIALATLGRDLHGRPFVSAFQLLELALVLAFVAWAAHRLLLVRHGHFTYFVIAVLALWQGAELIPTLLYGFVLAAEPAFVVRASCVVCLGSGIALILMVFRLADSRDAAADRVAEADSTWELA